MKPSVKHPRYVNIAIDVAKRIVNDEFLEGEKITGRSTLASYYHVSPETIRRSMCLIVDIGVVEIVANCGIIIKSKDCALDFINKFSSKDDILSLKQRVRSKIAERNKLNVEIERDIFSIVENCTQLKNIANIKHYEFEVKQGCPLANKTVKDVKFWHNTGATIIGAIRDNELLISTGPLLSDFGFSNMKKDRDLRTLSLFETFRVDCPVHFLQRDLRNTCCHLKQGCPLNLFTCQLGVYHGNITKFIIRWC